MKDKVTLYIATHNKTGLKYFGKTTCYFTQEDLQKYYHGSGTYWKNHIKKHGNDVTMEIYGIYNLNEVKEVALNFSEDNSIVESNNWANLMLENGLDGSEKGRIVSEETKIKLRDKNKGIKRGPLSKEHKDKISNSKTGIKQGPMSQERKDKIAKATKGVKKGPMSNETKKKLSLINIGNTHSEETKIKIGKASKGRSNKMSEETKIKISKSLKNKPRITCPHCNKVGPVSNMKQWHFDNCKNIKLLSKNNI